jgi:hypothetical protein
MHHVLRELKRLKVTRGPSIHLKSGGAQRMEVEDGGKVGWRKEKRKKKR